MGSTAQICVCWHRKRHIITSFLLVLLSSCFSNVRFMAEGARPSPTKLTEIRGGVVVENAGGVVVISANQIGSSPPKCERRCNGCGHCVAVQVPVAPQQVKSHNRSRRSRSSNINTNPKNIAYSRGDDISNYKPMSWKCKCGDLLFNP